MSTYNGKKGAFSIPGVPGVSEVYQVTTTSNTAGPRSFWDRWFKPYSNIHRTLASAEAALTGGINEVVLLSPESHSLSSSLTWDKNMSHLIGEYPASRMNLRSRIGMSTTFTPMMTISGYGNLFKSLYLMHGTASTDLVGVKITGDRNTFENVHFAGPMNAAQASEAGFIGVHLDGVAETYFKSCFFGNNTQAQDEASSLVKIGAGGGVTIFEDCIFMMRVAAGDTDPIFITVDNQTDTGLTICRNCLFVAEPGSGVVGGTPAIAIKFLGAGLGYVILDQNCQFVNVTNITATDTDQYLRMGCVFASTDDDVGMIAATPTFA